MNPIVTVDSVSTMIVASLDGQQTDIAVMSCLEAAVRIIKMTTGLTTIGAIDILIDSLSKVRIEEDKLSCPSPTYATDRKTAKRT